MKCKTCNSNMWVQEDEGDYVAECRFCGETIENNVTIREGKLYRGKREKTHEYEVSITINKEPLRHIVKHSPTGMEWGYGGSGPSDLALSILNNYFEDDLDKALDIYQAFKFDKITLMNKWEWILGKVEIDEWINANRK